MSAAPGDEGTGREQAAYVRVTLRPYASSLPPGISAFAVGMAVLGALGLGWLSSPQDVRTAGVLLAAFVFPLQLVSAVFAALARDTVAVTQGTESNVSLWPGGGSRRTARRCFVVRCPAPQGLPRLPPGLFPNEGSNMSRLVRQEIRAVGRELREKAGERGIGAGLLAAAAAAALYAGGCLVAGVVALLARVLPMPLAAMVVSAVLAAAAGVAGRAGLERLRRSLPLVPEQAADLAAAADNAGRSE
jgi:hypothetical protein